MSTHLAKVNLKCLHVFIAVSETQSFSKAAEVMHRSQSAVSMQIKQLEDQLGVSLFHRTTRRVELTSEGEELLQYAECALAALEDGLRQIRSAADIQIGQISIGCVPSLASSVLPEVLLLFQREYPGIKVNLKELPSEELLEAIRRQDVDFGVGPSVEYFGDANFAPVAREPIDALMRNTFFKEDGATISLESLSELPILMNSRAAALRGNLDRELAVRNLKLKIMFEVLHVQTLVAFARVGLGVAILPHVIIPKPLDKGMRALRIVDPALDRTVGIISLKGQSMSPASKMLAHLITQEFKRWSAPLMVDSLSERI
jgi:DNA-binding transcriptional LysR family regulator